MTGTCIFGTVPRKDQLALHVVPLEKSNPYLFKDVRISRLKAMITTGMVSLFHMFYAYELNSKSV